PRRHAPARQPGLLRPRLCPRPCALPAQLAAGFGPASPARPASAATIKRTARSALRRTTLGPVRSLSSFASFGGPMLAFHPAVAARPPAAARGFPVALTILGLSGALSHDPSAALYIDGKLIAAVEEERFVRDKHAKNRMPYE